MAKIFALVVLVLLVLLLTRKLLYDRHIRKLREENVTPTPGAVLSELDS